MIFLGHVALHLPQLIHFSESMWATLSTTVMASFGHSFTHFLPPMHPTSQALITAFPLSLELQAPLVRCVLAQLMRKGALPDVPQGDKGIQVKIVTGVEALGRGYDLTKVEQFLQLCATLPEAAQRLKTGNVLSIGASSLGLDGTQLVKSDEEVQAEMEQAQAMALAQQMAGPVAGNLTAPQQTPTQGG